MKTTRLLIRVLWLALLLSACLPAATPSPTPATTPTPTPAPQAWPPAAQAAATQLANQLGLKPEEITIVSAEERQWSDSCLGLGGPAEMCAAVITPGYLVTLTAGGETYRFRTSADGSALRQELDEQPTEAYPPAIEAALKFAADRAGIPVETITVVEYSPMNWSDSCLGVQPPNQMCLQVITPGYKVILETSGVRSEYHTDEAGSKVVFAASDSPSITNEVISWRQEGENCLSARVSLDGMIAAGACSGMMATLLLSASRLEQLALWINALQGFNASRGTASLTFNGSGSEPAPDAVQRSIFEWVRTAALETMGTPSPHNGLAFTWQRQGGIAGFCDSLQVYLSGETRASSCKGSIQDSGVMYLPAEKLTRLYAWVDSLAPFEIDHTDPATADAMTVKMSFYGLGTKTASEADQADLQAFASEQALYALAEPSAAELAAADQALKDYFTSLNQGNYAAAARLFGGSYATLTYMNPEINPADYPALWEAGCTRNGLVCMKLRDIITRKVINHERVVYTVEFSTQEGELFVLGPCCGASETEMPPRSIFEYTVRLVDSKPLVMELPVYVP